MCTKCSLFQQRSGCVCCSRLDHQNAPALGSAAHWAVPTARVCGADVLAVQSRRGIGELLARLGTKPDRSNAEACSFWVVSAAVDQNTAARRLQMVCPPGWPCRHRGLSARPSLAPETNCVQLLLPRRPVTRSPTLLTSLPQANLVCSCLAGEGELKRTFLSTRSTLERLDNQRQLLQQLGNVQQPGCSVM